MTDFEIPKNYYAYVTSENLKSYVQPRHNKGIQMVNDYLEKHKALLDVLGVKINGPEANIAFVIKDTGKYFGSRTIRVTGWQDNLQLGKRFGVVIDDEFLANADNWYSSYELDKAFGPLFREAAKALILGQPASKIQGTAISLPDVPGLIPALVAKNMEVPQEFIKALDYSGGNFEFFKEIQYFRNKITTDKKITLTIIPDKQDPLAVWPNSYSAFPDKNNLLIITVADGGIQINISKAELGKMGVIGGNYGYVTKPDLSPLRKGLAEFVYNNDSNEVASAGLIPETNPKPVKTIASPPAEAVIETEKTRPVSGGRPEADPKTVAEELPPPTGQPVFSGPAVKVQENSTTSTEANQMFNLRDF